MGSHRIATVAVLLLLVLGTGSGKELPAEVEDDPPAPRKAIDDPTARSAPMSLIAGPYVSVQVNVSSLGDNILGDAANEPSIAVNPIDPDNMVIGWRQFDSIFSNFRQAGVAYTLDKGKTWAFRGSLTPGTFRSDPVVDVDANGVFYYQSLRGNLLLDTFKSTNGGRTWGPPVPSYGGDKNWLVVDRSGGPGDGNLYGIWQRFAACCGANVLTRSVDDGASFEPPVSMALWPTFGTLAVGPDGTLFAAGVNGTVTQDLASFVVARSSNAQNPGTIPTSLGTGVDLGGPMRLGAAPNPAGLLGQANVVTDHSPGPTRGNVYVVASVSRMELEGDPLDVLFARSEDGGVTWSSPIRINDDHPAANWQWLAAASVAPNGRIDVIWYDTRGFDHNVSRLFYAYSWDAGATWSPNVAVSPSFDSTVGWPQQNKMGDYITLVSDLSGADVAYAATFNLEQDVYYVRLFPDCNGNALSDVTDVATDASEDCDADQVPDECQASPACLGAGGVSGSGAPLTVSRGVASDLSLAWGASCSPADADYAVYEGALGSFASPASRTCSTGGALDWTLTPSAGDLFFLVVPLHADREGSYGTDGAGAERSPAPAACRPQSIAVCGS